jgi:dephospho-CoA kinase
MKEELLIKTIHEKYTKKLKNLLVPHKKLMICFSGFSGSGKTYIAKILEERYNCVRIRTDDLREIIIKLSPKISATDKDRIIYKYLEELFENWKFKNKLLILDRGIDRKHKKTFSIFKKQGYKIFIIRLNVSKKTAFKRAFERNKGPDQHFINEINRWIKEWKDFGKNVKSDIIIKNEGKLDLKPLFKKLDKLVN